jgi:hypothetical protein
MPRDNTFKDLESGQSTGLRNNSSRITLPLSPTRAGERQEGESEDGDAFEWGPEHPCFPHQNPHVPLDSPLYQSTRIIRIQRDYMQVGDLAPTFTNLYPEVLDPLITEDEFRRIIHKVNTTLVDAFDPFSARAFIDVMMGFATFYLWEDLGLTGVKKQISDLERWIEIWNRDYGSKEGVTIIALRRTAFLSVRHSFSPLALCSINNVNRSTYKFLIRTSVSILVSD